MGLSREDADDCAQDVLLKWIEEPGAGDGLLYTLAAFRALTERKRASRRARVVQALHQTGAARSTGQIDVVEARRLLTRLGEWRARLTPTDAHIVDDMLVGRTPPPPERAAPLGRDEELLASLARAGLSLSGGALRVRRSRLRAAIERLLLESE